MIVEDAPGVGPISGHSRRCQQWGDWLVEEVMLVDELLLEFFGHFWYHEVTTAELAVQLAIVECFRHDLFHLSALSTRAHGRQRKSTNVTALGRKI